MVGRYMAPVLLVAELDPYDTQVVAEDAQVTNPVVLRVSPKLYSQKSVQGTQRFETHSLSDHRNACWPDVVLLFVAIE